MTAHDGSQPLEFQELAPKAMIAQAERFYAQMRARRSVRDRPATPYVHQVHVRTGPQQHLQHMPCCRLVRHEPVDALFRRVLARPHNVLRVHLDVLPFASNELDLRADEHEGGPAVRRLRVHVGLGFEELMDDIGVATRGRDHERRVPVPVGRLNVGARADELVYDVHMVVLCRAHERRPPIPPRSVHLGTSLCELLDDIGVAYQIHQGLQQQTTQQLQPCPTASFLTALPMPQLFTRMFRGVKRMQLGSSRQRPRFVPKTSICQPPSAMSSPRSRDTRSRWHSWSPPKRG